MSRKRKYERICHEVTIAYRRGDISPLEFMLLCFLALNADYQGGDEPEYTATRAGLRERLHLDGDDELFECSEENIYRALRKLKRNGWIDYETRTGRKARYVIRVKFERTIPLPWSREQKAKADEARSSGDRDSTEIRPSNEPFSKDRGDSEVPTPTPTSTTTSPPTTTGDNGAGKTFWDLPPVGTDEAAA